MFGEMFGYQMLSTKVTSSLVSKNPEPFQYLNSYLWSDINIGNT